MYIDMRLHIGSVEMLNHIAETEEAETEEASPTQDDGQSPDTHAREPLTKFPQYLLKGGYCTRNYGKITIFFRDTGTADEFYAWLCSAINSA